MVFSIIKHFTKTHRPTETGWKHVMRPRDPKQAAEEAPFCVAAFYRAAAESCALTAENNSVSAADVHRHMVERSKECPLVLAILQGLRCLEVFCVFEIIEKTQSADLFMAATRIALPFLMTLNAKRHMRSSVDMLVWWETTSEAERTLFEQFILCKRTSDMKPGFLDGCLLQAFSIDVKLNVQD